VVAGEQGVFQASVLTAPMLSVCQCAKQGNTYLVYAGETTDASAGLLRIDEISDDWNRCCCAPHHPLQLEIRQWIPSRVLEKIEDSALLEL
jgi:hypothetical protein